MSAKLIVLLEKCIFLFALGLFITVSRIILNGDAPFWFWLIGVLSNAIGYVLLFIIWRRSYANEN